MPRARTGIRKVFGPLDAQGCTVTSFKKPSELELAHDCLWRVHREVPRRHDRGVQSLALRGRAGGAGPQPGPPPGEWGWRYDEINDFERMLAANGTTILKFYLHISHAEHKERLPKRLEDPTENWKFNPDDLDERRRWTDYTAAYRDALFRCSTPSAPGTWYPRTANRCATCWWPRSWCPLWKK